DASTGSLHHVEELLVSIEANLVRETEAIGHDPEFTTFVARDISVSKICPEGVHPVLDASRDRYPQPVLRIPAHEVYFPDRLAANGVSKHIRGAVPPHNFQAVGAEVGDQEIAITREG